jgi:GNAT superfamily N-acetyltransferase
MRPVRLPPTRLPVVRCASPLVTIGLPRDLRFVVMLQKAHPAALGFLSREALREKIRLGQVLIARRAGERAGFLHHGSLARPEVRVFQVAVTPEARRGGVGRALVECLLARAARAGATGVSLRCLSFLDANRFWRSMGFGLHATEPGAKGTLNVWVRLVKTNPTSQRLGGAQFTFASRLHACPACGTPTVDTWVRGARRMTLCPACVAAAGLN